MVENDDEKTHSDNRNSKNLAAHIKNFISINGILILFIFSLALYIRAVLPHDAVFRGGIIGFAADDAVYHMRLVENLLNNFPHRIWFESFTH